MQLIYWSHSYRPEDEQVNRFFARLFEIEGLRVSFDPPSDSVNAAKLQRHLNGSDAMVAVLTRREGGPSPYIRFEIELCIRSRKPLLVFLEDVLEDRLIPDRILQRRFSRGSYFRQIREHKHALALLKTYLSDEAPPRYQPSVAQRACVVAGDDVLPDEARDGLFGLLNERGFRVVASSRLRETNIDAIEAITQADAAIAFIDAKQPVAHFSRGLLNGASVPMVEITLDPDFEYRDNVPRELQPLLVPEAAEWSELQPLFDRPEPSGQAVRPRTSRSVRPGTSSSGRWTPDRCRPNLLSSSKTSAPARRTRSTSKPSQRSNTRRRPPHRATARRRWRSSRRSRG